MQPEPDPALNPVRIEHRITLIEERLDNRLTAVADQLSNLVAQMKIANGRTSKNEDAIRAEASERRREMEATHDKVDAIADGIAERIKMEAATKAGYIAGQQAVTVKLPIKGLLAICSGLSLLITTALGAIAFVAWVGGVI